MGTFEVHGSYGDITASATTGQVLEITNDEGNDPESRYTYIARFDVLEWEVKYGKSIAGEDLDILDLGYWTKPGEPLPYEPPAHEWRKERR